MASNNK